MSQSASLRLDLRPSPLLAGALAVAHVLALAAAAAALSGWPMIVAVTGIVASCAVTMAHALGLTRAFARALELQADGRAAWYDAGGERHEAVLAAQRFVTPALVVVALEGERSVRKWIVLAPDAADGESRRRLRAWLRWRPEAAQDHGKSLWND